MPSLASFRAPSSLPLSSWGNRRNLRVGLLGGSFNPAHEGHRHISLEALRRLGLDEIWWLVSPQNPLKRPKDTAPLSWRLNRAQAVSRHPRIRIASLEANYGTRYTVDTLRILKQRFPRTRFLWLMGADNLEQIPHWRRWTQLFASIPIAILDRSPYSARALAGKAAHRFAPNRFQERNARSLADRGSPGWVFLAIRRHAASASALRLKGLGFPFSSSRNKTIA